MDVNYLSMLGLKLIHVNERAQVVVNILDVIFAKSDQVGRYWF